MNLIKVTDTKQIALLIDPDKLNDNFAHFIENASRIGVDYFFVGGSVVRVSVKDVVEKIKNIAPEIPVILFPGDSSQFTDIADGILYLSLISGRNPEYLIGQHVKNSVFIKNSNVEVIPTAYILIDGGAKTSVQKVSKTEPINSNDIRLAVSTAVAGELLGMQAVYLEAGSGASRNVPIEMIFEVKQNISKMLIVGGGIKTTEQINNILKAGADIVVVGNSIEDKPGLLKAFIDTAHSF